MKMKMKKLGSAIAIASTMVMASNVAFAAAGDMGDSRIHSPVTKTIITDKSSADIWFVAATDADFYSISLLSTAAGFNNCGIIDPNNEVEVKKMISATSSTLSCGEETVGTLGGSGFYEAGADAALHLCKWTTPDLANGSYQIAINSIKLGEASMTEVATNCDVIPLASVIPLSKDKALDDNDHRTPESVGFANKDSDNNYHQLVINKTAPGVAITQVPSTPLPILPAAGASRDGIDEVLTFTDSSPDEGEAKWYELWIYNKDSERVTDFNDNIGYNNWFKVLVDANELTCTDVSGGATGGAGTRKCEITLVSAEVDAALTTDTFSWWVRGNNSEGNSSWSASPGTFTGAH